MPCKHTNIQTHTYVQDATCSIGTPSTDTQIHPHIHKHTSPQSTHESRPSAKEHTAHTLPPRAPRFPCSHLVVSWRWRHHPYWASAAAADPAAPASRQRSPASTAPPCRPSHQPPGRHRPSSPAPHHRHGSHSGLASYPAPYPGLCRRTCARGVGHRHRRRRHRSRRQRQLLARHRRLHHQHPHQHQHLHPR